MSIKIHHGSPGSFKTSGAVMDDFIVAAKAGRVVITNVRGLNDRRKVIDTISKLRKFPKFWKFHAVPDSFDIIWIDTETLEGRQKLASFFHWAPHGAFLLVDEAQTVWPLAWKESDLKRLDYPGGYDAAVIDNRPQNFLIAFEKHRHYGWDMVLTTPNIDKIRKDIRGCSEGAYKHKNQALIGFKGIYLEAFHLADDNGSSSSQFLSIRNRRIKKHVWQLYASTATGTHSDTIAGTPIWANPRVLFFLVLLASLYTFLAFRHAPAIISGKTAASSDKVDSPKTSGSPATAAANNVGGVAAPAVDPVNNSPFSAYKWRLAGVTVKLETSAFLDKHRISQYFYIKNDDEEIFINTTGLNGYGYNVQYIDQCHVEVTYKDQKPFPVFCKSEKKLNATPLLNAKL
ncbi:zona occludens toxin [Methylobacter tundripaludum]|uniref:Zona occludens toxin n=1 Tax=Methylobacter tundripaludum TaxID=173365 RepID=A0A2S6H326_9GAMM|nr:zonular occludens toxin domain-containing protein [Methylobacter tundripaludum]PPK71889.1 zona occludens toxin [Methylobacter tundripaludum]